MDHSAPTSPVPTKKPLYKNLTFQVVIAVAIGVAIGHFHPKTGVALEPLKSGFIALIKMVVSPIIFLTIVVGIATMGDLKKVGRVGLKAILYFEIVTTLALVIGIVVANAFEPGKGFMSHPATQTTTLTTNAATTTPATTATNSATTTAPATKKSTGGFGEFLMSVIPDNVFKSFAEGNILQILFFSVLFGVALSMMGERGQQLITSLELCTEVMFKIIAIVMKVAPLGALGAMAFAVGEHGLHVLIPLGKLMACVYLTSAAFIFIVLGLICRFYGVSLWRFLVFIKDEIILVVGTSSSETVLPRMMTKLTALGCSENIVRMVIPAGYSFNLDGTSIYLSMSMIFIAQAYEIPLTLGQQLLILAVLMLTSKGAAGVTGSGLVTLQATLKSTKDLPANGADLVVGVDRFMSEARALTNLIGNGVATIVVSKMEKEFDQKKYEAATAKKMTNDK